MKYLTFDRVLYIVAIIILLIILLRGCGNRSADRAKENKRISDSVAAAYEKRIADFNTNEKRLKDSLFKAKLKADSSAFERNRTSSLLRQSNSKAVELANRLEAAKKEGNEIVYITICDSMGNIIKHQEGLIDELVFQIEQTDSLMNYEVSIRDEVIELLQNKFVACDSAYRGEKARLNSIYDDLRPRGQVWAGGEISGSAITPFNQVGVVLSYVPKSGSKRYDVGGGLMVTGGYYVKVGAAFKLSFRK